MLNNLKTGQLRKLGTDIGINIPKQIGKDKLIDYLNLKAIDLNQYVQGGRGRLKFKKK